ncbi:MAG: SRPBCC domain-containing protein [Chitinophagales bacterium]|nr:SRPBCC domain-containing protein [Chitinophagales bacterium]
MSTTDFTTSFLVDQTPQQAFDAITNVRGWWSENIEGPTDKLNQVFIYRYKDVHISKIKITDLVPGQKVVWQVLENHFNFTKDKTEWTGTTIVFEISEQSGKTQVRFTHQGLVPQYECFDICSNAWTTYINGSLKDLINTGTGKPNPIEHIVNEAATRAQKLNTNDYRISVTVNATAHQTFEAINSVTKWWTEDFKGDTKKLNDEFTATFGETYITSKVTELLSGKKIVWLVTDCNKHWLKNKKEWVGSTMVWELEEAGNKTKINFTHVGLVPGLECYNGCENAWNGYIKSSLLKLINEGKSTPELI